MYSILLCYVLIIAVMYSIFSGLLFSTALVEYITAMIFHLLKMYIPQYKYLNFIYSIYIFSIQGYITNSQVSSSQLAWLLSWLGR